ncbi:MAG: hypothetical protein HFJ29_08325 [Clostridia bacterium]|nr:hypothetical protein [Clostridia bacterium]
MEQLAKFEEYRKCYPEFWYNCYSAYEDEKTIYLEYEFEIPNLAKFHPKLQIDKKNLPLKSIDTLQARNMIFHIGMVELISYWKCTCSPKVVLQCGYLSPKQIEWWKKLYFYGLGELFYCNKIQTDRESFMEIQCKGKEEFVYPEIQEPSEGYIVPIGGGKDSVVTLETLNRNQEDYGLIINPKPTTLKCAQIAGIDEEHIIEIRRTIDKNLIELNSKGFINGHTPFSAMLAFVSYFIAYLTSKKYIALSNENSANESNIVGEMVNHQYSKSFEFEKDFTEYTNQYLRAPVKYFSFLRPLNELQIAKIFAKQEQYHQIFKSCNVGSKGKEWVWCCNCAKCLFAYIILSPYLYPEKLISIFKEDLFQKQELLDTFLELTGNRETKPFDCVGTFEEVNFAISKVIQRSEQNQRELPYLLKYYKEHYELVDTTQDITKNYHEENNLTKEQNEMLRKALFQEG